MTTTPYVTRTGSAVFADTGQAVQSLEFAGSDKRRAAARRAATEQLAPLFRVDTVRHLAVAPNWTAEEYSGLNGYKALSRKERALDLVGAPADVARFLSALPRILAALETQATAGARRLGAWLRTAAGQTHTEDRTPDGLRYLRADFRAAVYRRCVENVVDVPCTVPHVDADRPLVEQAEAVADRVSFEALIDVHHLVDDAEAAAIADAFHVVPLDETADSDDTRAVLAAAAGVVDTAAAAALEDAAPAAEQAPAEGTTPAAADALPCGLTVSVARSAWRDWWAADCTRCTGHAVQISGEHADKADAVAAAWDHYDAKHRDADDRLTLDEIDRAVALAGALSQAQYDVLWDTHLADMCEDAQGFYTYSVHTDKPVKRSRDRVVRLMFAGYLSAHPEGEHRRTFRLTAEGDRARRLLFRARRHGVVELGDKDGHLDVPAAKLRRYPLLSDGHPVRCGLLPEQAPAAAVVQAPVETAAAVVPDTVDEVLAAAGATAPVDVVDAAVADAVQEVFDFALVGAGAVAAAVPAMAGGLPHHPPVCSIRRVGNSTGGNTKMTRENLPKMTTAQASAFDHMRRSDSGHIGAGEGFNRRSVAALVDLNLAVWVDNSSRNWSARLAAPGLAIRDEQAPALDLPEGTVVKVVSAGTGRPQVHTADCDDYDRETCPVETRTVRSLEELAARVYRHEIADGLTVADAVAQLDVHPCAHNVPRTTPAAAAEEAPAAPALADPVTVFAEAVAEQDDAPATDDQAVAVDPPLTVHQAREAVWTTWGHTEGFEPHHDEDGAFQGYTFRVGQLHNARYGWITGAGTYGKSLEPYRSHAAQMLPAQILDDARTAARRAELRAERDDRVAAEHTAHGAPARDGDRPLFTATETEAAEDKARAVHPDAHQFVPFVGPGHGLRGHTFRVSFGAGARYGWVLANGSVGDETHMFRTKAERVAWAQPFAVGRMPEHAHDDAVANVLDVLDGMAAAWLSADHDVSEPTPEQSTTRGYLVEPRGGSRVAVYWLEGGRAIRRDNPLHGGALDSVAARFEARGWAVEKLLRSSHCVFAHPPLNPAHRPVTCDSHQDQHQGQHAETADCMYPHEVTPSGDEPTVGHPYRVTD